MNRVLHAITASFHEIKDHRRKNRVDHEKVEHGRDDVNMR